MVKFVMCILPQHKKNLKGKKKEPDLDGLKTSQPFQMAKDTKIKKFTMRKGHSNEKAKGITVQHFAKILQTPIGQNIQSYKRPFQESKGMSHISFQSNQRAPRKRKGMYGSLAFSAGDQVEKGLIFKIFVYVAFV